VTHVGAAVLCAVMVTLAVKWAGKPRHRHHASSGLELA
jgi:hypothetical protein